MTVRRMAGALFIMFMVIAWLINQPEIRQVLDDLYQGWISV